MSLRFGELRESVYRANLDLAASGLVMGTFGNVSGVDRAAGRGRGGVRGEQPEPVTLDEHRAWTPRRAGPVHDGAPDDRDVDRVSHRLLGCWARERAAADP